MVVIRVDKDNIIKRNRLFVHLENDRSVRKVNYFMVLLNKCFFKEKDINWDADNGILQIMLSKYGVKKTGNRLLWILSNTFWGRKKGLLIPIIFTISGVKSLSIRKDEKHLNENTLLRLQYRTLVYQKELNQLIFMARYGKSNEYQIIMKLEDINIKFEYEL